MRHNNVLPRQESLVVPPVRNPFVHRLKLGIWDMIKVGVVDCNLEWMCHHQIMSDYFYVSVLISLRCMCTICFYACREIVSFLNRSSTSDIWNTSMYSWLRTESEPLNLISLTMSTFCNIFRSLFLFCFPLSSTLVMLESVPTTQQSRPLIRCSRHCSRRGASMTRPSVALKQGSYACIVSPSGYRPILIPVELGQWCH